MAGNIGSPLCAELNRIANNGVYPDRDDFLEEQGAANVWAGTTGQGLLGALNYIVDPSRTENNFSDLTKVCNELAGTTGLSDVDALRTINHPAEVLLRGTTPQSAVFTTDAATPRYNYPGYIYTDGTSGNNISTPSTTGLQITGDIDIRWYGTMDDWSPAANVAFISKNFTSYEFINSFGNLALIWRSGATDYLKQSTVSIPFTDGSLGWVRATLDVDNGSSGNDVKFFTSTNGTTWTQLGTTVTTAGTTSINTNTNALVLNERSGTTWALAGRLYRAQIFASIDGTDKRFDADLTTNVTSATYDQFTTTTGQLCTINGQNTLTNMGKAGSLLPVTVGSSLAADSNDAKFLAHDGTNYVYVPGVVGNNISVPDGAALDIAGDIEIVLRASMDDWTPASTGVLFAKDNTGVQRSWTFDLLNNGALRWVSWNSAGTLAVNVASSIVPPFVDGVTYWLKVTADVDNGAGGNDVKFWYALDQSTEPTVWTQLGTTQTTAGVTDIFNSIANVTIGDRGGALTPVTGSIRRAILRNGIGGTTVLDVDTSVITTGAATSFTATTGQTVTINRSTSGRKTVAVTQPTWLFGTDDYMEVNNRYMAHSTSDENYVYLSGASGNYMSVADNPPLDITGDLDLQVKVALDDWTPSANNSLIYKWDSAGTSASYGLRVNATSGVLIFLWTENGSTVKTATSTVAPTVTDGSALWIRATLDVNNGASGNTVTFYTSTDGTNWTQLGSAITTAGVTSIFSGTGPLEIGSFAGGLVPAKGKFYRAIIKNGIDGTTVLDANAATILLPSQTTFTDSSSNAYTVTINKSGVGTFVSTGNYLYLPGIAGNYASAPDSAALDITGDIDLRVKLAMDDWTPSTVSLPLGKVQTTSQRSYWIEILTNGRINLNWSTTGSNVIAASSTVAPTVTDGSTLWIRVTLDVDNGAVGNTATFFTSPDGLTWTQLGSPVVTAGVTSIYSSTSILEIGSGIAGTYAPVRGKIFRAQVLNGINGTVAFDANFENSITSLNQASFTESSSNAATVTINRSGDTYESSGILDAGYLYPGATNTFRNSTLDHLNFGASDSFTVVGVFRQWNTPIGAGVYIAKKDMNANANQGWAYWSGGSGTVSPNIGDGSNNTNPVVSGFTVGTSTITGFVVSRESQTLRTIIGSTLSTAINITSIGNLSNIFTLRIGRNPGFLSYYQDMEFVGAAVFRSALTSKNLADINNYFNGRD